MTIYPCIVSYFLQIVKIIFFQKKYREPDIFSEKTDCCFFGFSPPYFTDEPQCGSFLLPNYLG